MIRLVLGGEKSGKSDFAYELFRKAPGRRVVMAMGQARDMAFRQQILEHRLRRDPAIPVVEPGIELAAALAEARASECNALVDSLDFWLFACMEAKEDRADRLVQELANWSALASECVLVSGEIGLGPVAADPLTRCLVRELGALNQRLAALAPDVRFVAAGLPIQLKREAHVPFQAAP